MGLGALLDIAGVICLGLQAFGVSGARVNTGFLGLFLIGVSHLLLPLM